MTWRTVCITEAAKLELKLGYLVVRGETVARVALSEINTLLIESTAAAITTSLLCELSRRKIKVVFCDEKHNPYAELTDYYGSVDSTSRIRNQIAWPVSLKNAVWTEIVRDKLNQQAALLERREKPEAELIRKYISELKPADSTNREGHAAKVYFNALFGRGFSREKDIPINAALNYGYSILLSSFNKEILSRGYLTQLGLFHDNQFNPFNFSSDLMEPFRPLVDELVLNLQPAEFAQEQKHAVLTLLNHTVVIEESKQRVLQAINLYCSSVFRALEQEDTSQLSFYTWSDSCE
ncbi:MAG: type II CRISPR-associated endonuclease Cas1 [Anaerolineaceae bacterium]|jgi:CRISPR-associated protein Cas1